MRLAIVASACLLGAAAALANPVAFDMVFVDFDPPNFVGRLDTTPGAVFDAYIVVSVDAAPGGQFKGVALRLEVSPEIVPLALVGLDPIVITDGDWETGVILQAPDCVGPGPIPVGVFQCLYVGSGPGDILIRDHPIYPRHIWDCEEPQGVIEYCVLWHGGINKDPLVGDCGGNPVEDASWGAIKGLYR
jgi:hypothetical protein